MRFTRSVATLVTSTVMVTAAMLATPTTASADDGDTVTSSEVAVALDNTENADGNLVSEPAPSTTDANSAAIVAQNGMTTEVPKNPEDGVTFATDGAPPITIGLPNADESKDAKRLSDGTVVYPGSDSSASAVIPTEHGVQMLTTIENADAPTRFAYKVGVPDGGKVQITEDGSAAILDTEGAVILAVPTPWAKDANGMAVPTKFESNGTTLTQVVEHTSSTNAYPVVADPFWIAPAAIAGAFQAAVWACGAGYLGGVIWHIAWGNSWAWDQVRRSGRQGCIEGVVGRFIPWRWIKGALRLK